MSDVTDTVLIIPNGNDCDSIITYSLYVYRNVYITFDSVLCENNLPLIWNDVEFTSDADTSVILRGSHGVDSVVNMRVTILRNTSSVVSDSIIVAQLPWNYLGVDFMHSITDTVFMIQNVAGCDSVITYSLYIYPNVSVMVDSVVCENNIPLIWNGVEFWSEGDSIVVLIGEHGEDSAVNMTVTILRNPTAIKYDTIVENQLPWNYLGYEFVTDVIDTLLTISNGNDCDSIITYSLYVRRNIVTELDSSVCENNLPLVWNGVLFNSASDTTVVLVGEYGEDSIVTMHVTVLPIFRTVEEIYLCLGESVTWIDGITYSYSTDEPIFIFQAINGCDSIVNLNLRVDNGTTESCMKVSPKSVTYENRMVNLNDLSKNNYVFYNAGKNG